MATNAQSIQFLLSQVRASGVVLSGGTVEFFAAGTEINKTIWTDRGKTQEAANPYTLDANGTAQLYGDGLYRMVVKDSAGVTKYDRDYQAFKDASGYSYDLADYDSLSAAITAIGSTKATLQFGADIPLTANVVVPANIDLVSYNGAKIIRGSYTITGLKTATPELFGGAVGVSTDSGAAINAAAASCKRLLFPAGNDRYYSSIALAIPAGVDVKMENGVTITAASGTALVGMTVGSAGVSNGGVKLEGIDITRTNLGTWGDTSHVGLLLYNCSSANVSIKQVTRFGGINLKAFGSGAGFQYSEIVLGDMGHAAYEVVLSNENSGYVNQNNWYGGRFWVLTGITDSNRNGITITSDDGSYLSNNNNHFYNPNFELGLSKTSTGFTVVHGVSNYVHGCRSEGNDLVAKFQNASAANTVVMGYDIATSTAYSNTSSSSDNYVYTSTEMARLAYNKPVFVARDLAGITNVYNGAGTYYTQGMSYNTNGNIGNTTATLTLKNDSIEISTRPVGVKVDTSTVKSFLLSRTGTAGGRVVVACYDSNGALLTSSGGGHPYVVGVTGAAFSYSANHGGVYQTGSDSLTPQRFTVGSDVKSIWVGVAGGSANAVINAFALYTNDANAPTVTTGATPVPMGRLAVAVPSVGTHDLGVRYVNATPAVGQPKAWVTTVAGTFGTLSATTGNITTGTTALVVNDASGLAYGMYITIAGVSGVKRITKIVGTAVTIDSAANATVTGAAIAYQTPTLTSEGNL